MPNNPRAKDNLRNGGTNKGGPGRPPDWLKAKCCKIVKCKKLVEFLADVASGKDFEQGVGSEGEVIKIPASIKDRIKATETLIERGFGKAVQPLSGEDGQGGRFIMVFDDPNNAAR